MRQVWDLRAMIARLDCEKKGWRATNHNVKNTVAEYAFYWREIAKKHGELGLQGAITAAETRLQTAFGGVWTRMLAALQREQSGTKKQGERGRLNELLSAI